LSRSKAVDPFLTEFGSFYEGLKAYPPKMIDGGDSKLKDLKEKTDLLVREILSGSYVRERGKDYVVSADGRRTSLANSSSGQQEMVPLAAMLGALPFVKKPLGGGYTIYIEEPEAHLFPLAQKRVVELIATRHTQSPAPTQFMITTHSPYVLAAVNNLIHAASLAAQLGPESTPRIAKIVPQEQWLDPGKVSVYSLDAGQAVNIKSPQTGLIAANLLDSVSDKLGDQFDQLLEVD
jgi:hypothetical protein